MKIRSKTTPVKLIVVLTLLSIMGCDQLIPMPDPRGNMPKSAPLPTPIADVAFVVTTDYSISSGFAVVNLDDHGVYLPDPVDAAQVVSPDPKVVAYDDYVFVINRLYHDNVTVLDRDFNLVAQYSVADPSCPLPNPHDLAFISLDKAYLTRYGCVDLLVLNPLTGERLGTVEVPPEFIDPGDGLPEMSGALMHGATLYVALQKLDRNGDKQNTWPTTDNSLLLMIDTAADLAFGEIILTGKNPVTDVVYDPGLDRILVGDVGMYWPGSGDGGIEAVNPQTAASEGYLIDEAGMGGQLGDFAIVSPTRGYLTVQEDLTGDSNLYGFDPSTGVRDLAPIYSSPDDFAMWEIELNARGELYVCDRNATDPGIAIIDVINADALLTPTPLSTWLPPFSVVFLR